MGYVVLSLQNASELCRRRPGIARLLLWLTNPVPKLRCLEVYRGVRSPVVAAQYLSGTEWPSLRCGSCRPYGFTAGAMRPC